MMYNDNVQNERLLNRKLVRAPQGRYFALISYLNREQIKKVLDHYASYIDSALYILHNKDFKATDSDLGKLKLQLLQVERAIATTLDDSERIKKLLLQRHLLQKELAETEVLRQTPEEEHWHIIIKFMTSRTESAVKKYFYRFRWTETKTFEDGTTFDMLINTQCEMIDDLVCIRDYLTHEDDPDKYHYDKKDVYQWGRGWECFNAVGQSVDSAMDVVDRLNNGCSLRRLAKEYGRDFIYHYKAYSEFSRAVAEQEIRAQNYVDLFVQCMEAGTLTIESEDSIGKRSVTLDPRKYNKALEIVTEFENDFQLYYQGE